MLAMNTARNIQNPMNDKTMISNDGRVSPEGSNFGNSCCRIR